jgi:hypothetical protein
MSKKPQSKPLFSIKNDYDASLKHFIERATILADAIRPLLEHDLIKHEGIAAIVKAKLDDFDAAM